MKLEKRAKEGPSPLEWIPGWGLYQIFRDLNNGRGTYADEQNPIALPWAYWQLISVSIINITTALKIYECYHSIL